MGGGALKPDLVEALARLDAIGWSGEVWRHTFSNQPPERTNTRGARWNPPGVEALYTSLDAATAMAEAAYMIQMQPLPPTAGRQLHRLRVSLDALVDLSTAMSLDEIGVSLDDVISDDYSICQSIGEAAAFIRLDGLLVPSARAPGSNLVILFPGSDLSPVIEVVASDDVG